MSSFEPDLSNFDVDLRQKPGRISVNYIFFHFKYWIRIIDNVSFKNLERESEGTQFV